MKLKRSTPEAQGIHSKALVNFFSALDEANQNEKLELHSFMFIKNGHVISEAWWKPYSPDFRHKLFSLSKSFTSTAIGFAVGEGRLTVNDKVIDYFPDEVKELGEEIDGKMKTMTVKNLLTMGTGQTYEAWDWDNNNVKSFLRSHVKNEPGSVFCYNTLATYMLSAIITKIYGIPLIDFLRPRLFDILDIKPYWEKDKLGNSFGGFGLSITTEDIAKFGLLYLNGGKWEGKQIISADWIKEATSAQISNGDDPDSDWSQGYGYQFWRCRHNIYRGDGMRGQLCVVIPEYDSVIAVTAGTDDIGGILNVIWDNLLPEIEGNTPLPEYDDYNKLIEVQNNLSHIKDKDDVIPFKKMYLKYKFENFFIRKISLDFTDNECIVALTANNNISPFLFKNGKWIDGVSSYFDNEYYRICTYSEFISKGEFLIRVRQIESPFSHSILFKFSEDYTSVNITVDNDYKCDGTLYFRA